MYHIKNRKQGSFVIMGFILYVIAIIIAAKKHRTGWACLFVFMIMCVILFDVTAILVDETEVLLGFSGLLPLIIALILHNKSDSDNKKQAPQQIYINTQPTTNDSAKDAHNTPISKSLPDESKKKSGYNPSLFSPVYFEKALAEANLDTRLKRAFIFLEDEDWCGANDYAEAVLDEDPENAYAYLVKMMISYRISNFQALIANTEYFSENKYYSRIIRFADGQLLSAFKNSRAQISDYHKEEERIDDYNRARKLMDLNTLFSLENALRIYQGHAEDAEAKPLIAECQRKIAAIHLAETKKAQRKKSIEKITIPIAIVFVVVLCIASVKQIIPNNHYNKGIEYKNNHQYENAISEFESAKNFKDSEKQIIDCKYLDAIDRIEKSDAFEGIAILKDLNNYNNCNELIEQTLVGMQLESLLYANDNDVIKYGFYEQDNINGNGKEELEWIVLKKSSNKLLLLSLYALPPQCFSTVKNDDGTYWEVSDIRSWLNEDLYENTFPSELQNQIDNTKNSNLLSSYKSANSTEDKLFLLSIDYVDKYVSDCAPCTLINGSGTCSWWLRTPGDNSQLTSFVDAEGNIDYYGAESSSEKLGIRPAMWVYLPN